MTKPVLRAGLAALIVPFVLPLFASSALAGPIDSACMRSGRDGANRPLCGCIQKVADEVLSRSDQRRAAKFFKDPDAAHAVWISQRPADDAFWERYKEFGAMAEAYCAG
ncbi:hypothetical protein MASR1M32_15050 [Rhodobacter sp.]